MANINRIKPLASPGGPPLVWNGNKTVTMVAEKAPRAWTHGRPDLDMEL
jgi:hypothetical protein